MKSSGMDLNYKWHGGMTARGMKELSGVNAMFYIMTETVIT